MKINFKKSLFILLVILLLGGFLRTYKLGQQSFIADEYLGINASYGYFKTGEWKFWDFNKEEITNQSYTRANVYYWQVAQLFKFLTPTEANSRLVSVFWGVLGIIIIFFITYYFTRKPFLALTAALLLAVSISALIYDRKLRMYSMFAPVYFLLSISIYQFLESPCNKKVNWLKNVCYKTGLNWFYLIPIVLLGWLSLQTHLLTVNIFPVTAIFILILAIYEFIKNKKIKNNKYFWLLLIIMGLIIGMFQTQYFKDALAFFNFVTHWGYLEKITLDYSYILIAGFFLLFGSYYLIKKYKRFGIWITLSFFITLASAIFIWDRNEGDQYIYLIEHFKVILYAAGIYFISLKLIKHKIIATDKKYTWPALILFFVFISINFNFFFSADSFYYDIKKWKHSNYREIYKYISDHRKVNDAIITRYFINYYLWGTFSAVIDYGDNHELTLEQIKESQKKYDRLWTLYSKDTYIDSKAEDYIKNNFKLIKTPYTNNKILLWLWTKEDENKK